MFFAGYMHIKYANPEHPLNAGFSDIGDYVLAFVTNNAYNTSKTVQVYWTGARYTVFPNLDLTTAYYGYQQNAYGTGKQGGCSTSAHRYVQRKARRILIRRRLSFHPAIRRVSGRDVQRRA